jgi:hypothetical protein
VNKEFLKGVEVSVSELIEVVWRDFGKPRKAS